MQQALVRKYSNPEAFQRDLPQLAHDGWTVQRVEKSPPLAGAPTLLQPRPDLVVTFMRGHDDAPVADPLVADLRTTAAEYVPPPTFISRWGKGIAAAGVAVILLASMAAIGQGRGSSAASGDSTFSITLVADDKPAPSQAAPQARDPKLVAYTQQLGDIVRNHSSAYASVAGLATKPQLTNDPWRTQMTRSLGDLKTVDAALRSLQPPACLTDLHRQLLEAAAWVDRVADQITGAIKVESTSGVSQSAPTLASMNSFFRETASKLQAAGC